MSDERYQIHLAPGAPVAEVIIREGAAPRELDPKAPVKTDLSGTIGTVVEYLSKRLDSGQFDQKDCHILVDRGRVEITLVINEADEYRRGKVSGKLSTILNSLSSESMSARHGLLQSSACSSR